MPATLDIRPSPIAGQWYPADEKALAKSVDAYIAAAQIPTKVGAGASPELSAGSIRPIGIVAPHAGHRYSGAVAGYAFATLRGLQPDIVAVISPMHQPYSQPLLTSAHAFYSTPLGTIAVDRESLLALDRLLNAELGFGLTPVKNDSEHSLEIELPFLQRVLAGEPPFRLLPVMVRDQSAKVVRALGGALAKVLQGRKSILVASTDLSHFYPGTIADKLDAEMLRRIEAFDPEAVLSAEGEGVGFACGRAALAAVLWAAKDLGATTVKVLKHATSGDVTGDYRQVVGYGAAVIY